MHSTATRRQSNLRLDRLDIRILAALQEDGRLAKHRLGEIVGLSATPCFQRVRRLEEAGYILSCRANLDVDRIGRHIVVYTEITLENQRAADFARFEHAIQSIPEIVDCHLVSGGYDYLAEVVALDVAHYQNLMEQVLSRELGIARYFSYIAMKSVKRRTAFPLSIFEAREDGACES